MRVLTGEAHVLDRHDDEVYVHYVNTDKRLDEWVSESSVRPAGQHEAAAGGATNGVSRKRKRGSPGDASARRGSSSRSDAGSAPPPGPSESASRAGAAGSITEEEFDIAHQKQITAKRNFEKVIFGRWQIRTW